MSRLHRGGFTLVELLVVLAITSILMLLVFAPVVQSFNLTKEARAEAEAQATARLVIDQLSTELGNAAYIRDNTRPEAALWVPMPPGYFDPQSKQNTFLVSLQFAKIDFFPPFQGDPSNPNFNQRIGKIDPTVVNKSPVGQIELPMARSIAMVRYFIGLQRPLEPYINGSEDRMVTAAVADNLFVLYRAEVRIYNDDGTVNTRFFDKDATGQPILDEPGFFTYVKGDQLLGVQSHVDRIKNWFAASTVVSQLENTDLIQIVRDRKTKVIVWDNLGRPQVRSLMKFEPMRVDEEPAAPDTTTVQGEEAPNRAPSSFSTKYGGWNDAYGVTVWPSGSSPGAASAFYGTSDEYQNDGRYHKILWYSVPNPAMNGQVTYRSERLFDLTRYADSLTAGAPNFNSGIVSMPGSTANMMAFIPDPVSGKIVMDIPSVHVAPPLYWSVGGPTTYTMDPGNKLTVNGRLNYLYNQHRAWGWRIDRFISLRDEQKSPLNLWPNSSIIPNSETVIGPDQRTGLHYGQPIRYRRVSSNLSAPGLNEYQINYTSVPAGTLPGDMSPADQAVKDFILKRFNAGYIRFNSDPNYPIPGTDTANDPNSGISVTYHFQFNDPGAVVTVNYTTKEVLTISLGIRRYNVSSGTGHQVEVTNRVFVRNFLK